VSDQRHRTSDRRVIPGLLLGLLAATGGAYVATHYYMRDRVPADTTVNGIAVGGLRPEAAERRLEVGLLGRAAEPLTVVADGHRATIRPAAAGFRVDVPATVAKLHSSPGWDPARMWNWLAGRTREDAVVTVDEAALDRAVASFARQVDDPAVEGAVTFADGQARATYPETGRLLDRPAAADRVRRAFLQDNGSGDVVRLRTRVAEPVVTKDAVSRAMNGFANAATSAPVVIRFDHHAVRLQPDELTPALSMTAVGPELSPRLDERVLLATLKPRTASLARAPQNARISLVDGRPRLTPARNGRTFDPSAVVRGLIPTLTAPDRTLTVRSVPAPPSFTTADARRLAITEQVSAFSTRFPYAAYRNTNLGRAAQLIDGTILRPGQTFSLNDTVGQRTAANGFTQGYIIDGGVFRKDFGGGVSQVATTTFNAAFFAGLADVEHKAHSFYISRYPAGREATVVWPDVDLRFKNTTPYGVLVAASIERATPSRKGVMHVSMYSTKYWDIRTTTSPRYDPRPFRTRHLRGADCVPNEGYDGFDIDVHRLFYRHGSTRLDHRETIHTAYAPSDTVVCS
jgi:vancomycin resistance protein YoaR